MFSDKIVQASDHDGRYVEFEADTVTTTTVNSSPGTTVRLSDPHSTATEEDVPDTPTGRKTRILFTNVDDRKTRGVIFQISADSPTDSDDHNQTVFDESEAKQLGFSKTRTGTVDESTLRHLSRERSSSSLSPISRKTTVRECLTLSYFDDDGEKKQHSGDSVGILKQYKKADDEKKNMILNFKINYQVTFSNDF